MKNKIILLFVLLFVLLFFIPQAMATISFIDPTPANNSVNTTGSVFVNTSVTNEPVNSTALINWNNSLVGWWRMNEAAGGTLVEDFSGYGNNGTWYGNTTSNVTTGRFGNALLFDEVNDYVDIEDNNQNISLSHSFSLWINNPDVTLNYKPFISKGISNAMQFTSHSVDGKLYLQIWNGTANEALTSTGKTTNNTWNQIGYTWNASNKQLIMYINGTEDSNITFNGVPKIAIEDNIRLARWSTVYTNVAVDDVQMYNRVLNASEFAGIYNSSNLGVSNNFTNLDNDDILNYTAYSQDTSGTVNSTEKRYVAIDTLTECPATITYNANNDTVTTNTGTGNWLDVECISDSIDNSSLISRPDLSKPNEWLSNINIYTSSLFYINSSTVLKLNSTWNGTTQDEHFIRYKGGLQWDNATVISWNTTTNSPSLNNSKRSYIYQNEGGIGNYFVNITNSNLSYLGSSSDASLSWGVKLYYVINIFNNTFFSNYYGLGITTSDAINSNISRNQIQGFSKYGIISTSTNKILITNNTIIGQNNYRTFDFGIVVINNANNNTISYNNISDVKDGIVITASVSSNSIDHIINNNSISLVDKGISIINSRNISINYNNITNTTRDTDGYNTGIEIFDNVSMVVINYNILTMIGSSGISVYKNSSNVTISNNSIDLINVIDKSGTYMGAGVTGNADVMQYPYGIGTPIHYKGWTQNLSESNQSTFENDFNQFQSRNITLLNNIFGANITIALFDEGSNVTHDIEGFDLYNYSVLTTHGTLVSNRRIYTKIDSTIQRYGYDLGFTGFTARGIKNYSSEVYGYYIPIPGKIAHFNYNISNNKLSIRAKGYELQPITPFTTFYHTHFTQYNIQLYNSGRIFEMNINNTIFSNGTTQITLTNESDMPNWYSTINATIISSTTVYVTVNTYNSTLFNFTVTGSGTMNITVNNSDFTVTNGLRYSIKKDGVIQQAVIASGDSVSFTNIAVGSDYEIALGGISSITIPANSWGMFNNWSSNLTFSQIAANESNDVAYTWFNTTSGDWEDFYVGQTYNQNNIIPYWASVLGYFNAQTTITATVVTPANTTLTVGWNMLYVEGSTNRTLSEIQTNIALSCTVNDLYKWNTTTADYDNAGASVVQPNEGFIVDIASGCTWVRSTI